MSQRIVRQETFLTEQEQQQQKQGQFKCKCQKSYRSYPALYTHIKNKHSNNIEEFKSQSKKPKEGQIEKGRPKKHKDRDRPRQAEFQGQLLNIIQLGILQIQECLRKESQKNTEKQKFEILHKNSRLKQRQLDECYDSEKRRVIQKISEGFSEYDDMFRTTDMLRARSQANLSQELPVKVYKEQIRFKSQLIQHFKASTASRILIQLEIIQIQNQLQIALSHPKKNQDSLLLEQNYGNQDFSDSDAFKIIKASENQLWQNNFPIIKIVRNIHRNWSQKLCSINQGHQGVKNDYDSQQNQDQDQDQSEQGPQQ